MSKETRKRGKDTGKAIKRLRDHCTQSRKQVRADLKRIAIEFTVKRDTKTDA
jgi:transcriptional antiterminator